MELTMAGAKRTASVVWEGDLMSGGGTITETGSGAFGNLPVTWKARTESSEGKTSPEELISAALASCFSMALSGALARGGNQPQKLEVSATTTFSLDGGAKVDSIDLDVRGTVDGMDEAAFEEAARGAGENCPVSQALKGNVSINVTAKLA
jgi:lipoyl-dependent peroxiredoxin